MRLFLSEEVSLVMNFDIQDLPVEPSEPVSNKYEVLLYNNT